MIRRMTLLAAFAALAACSPKPEKADEPAALPAAAGPVATGETKAAESVNKEQEITTPGAAKDATTTFRNDSVDIVIAPKGDAYKGDRLEYKIRMKAGDTVAYSWDAGDAAELWHEFHGHDDKVVSFYKKAGGARHQGTLTAPFDGIHGWYFENRSPRQVIIHLRMGGFYQLEPSK